jgi:hypothetical protein
VKLSVVSLNDDLAIVWRDVTAISTLNHVAIRNPHKDSGSFITNQMKSGLPLTFTSKMGVKVDTIKASAEEHTVREQELTVSDAQQDASNSV